MMNDVNMLVLIASIGRRLQKNDDLGAALFGAAVDHEKEWREWETAKRHVPSATNIGEIEKCGDTLAEFFANYMPILQDDYSPEQREAIESLRTKRLENGKTGIEIHFDKMEALRKIGEYAGYLDVPPASRWQRLVRWFKGLV